MQVLKSQSLKSLIGSDHNIALTASQRNAKARSCTTPRGLVNFLDRVTLLELRRQLALLRAMINQGAKRAWPKLAGHGFTWLL